MESAPTRFHPRWYRKRMPIFWWVHKSAHIKFITRELTSIFVALFAVELILLLHTLSRGPAAYGEFVLWLGNPVVLVFNGVFLLFTLYHSITWFNLAPRALVVHVAGRRLPGGLILAANYAGWILCTLAVTWLLLFREAS